MGVTSMATRRQFTTEQIIRQLREAEVLLAKGQTVAQICKQLGVTDHGLSPSN
jgi:hypothetical protein